MFLVKTLPVTPYDMDSFQAGCYSMQNSAEIQLEASLPGQISLCFYHGQSLLLPCMPASIRSRPELGSGAPTVVSHDLMPICETMVHAQHCRLPTSGPPASGPLPGLFWDQCAYL